MVGAAKADVTPVQWPVAVAAYGVGRMATGADRPFYARSVAIRSCPRGSTVVLTALDSQGYFAGYKEDPGPGAAGYGLSAIRAAVSQQTAIPIADLLISATHTHNSPDSIGLWGGSVTPNNKAPYLSLVKARTVTAIEAALADLQPARLRVGIADVSGLVSTLAQVQNDPSDYPVDHWLRLLQATAPDGRVIATVADGSIHATVAGSLTVITPDWPGRLADDLDARFPGETAVVFAGALGRTGPRLPAADSQLSDLERVRAYGDLLFDRALTALTDSRPMPAGPVATVDTHLVEEISNPIIAALFTDEAGTPYLHGVMRAIVPPFQYGPVVPAEVETIRVGDLVFAGVPGEGYPEVGTELTKRIHRAAAVFPISLANDQIGYLPPAFEWPIVAWLDTGDNGVFSMNPHIGDDAINQHLRAARQLGFGVQYPYNGLTAGPVYPPGSTPGTGPIPVP